MTAANEFPLRNLFNTFTIFNFNTFITFNITLTPLTFNSFNTLSCKHLENTYKIPLQETFKKSFRNFFPSYLHVQYFEETGTIKTGINWAEAILYLSNLSNDWSKTKKASLLLPTLLLSENQKT